MRPLRFPRHAAHAGAALAALSLVLIAAGCGSRGPLDGQAEQIDAGVDTGVDANVPDVAPDTGPPDAGQDSGPNPIDCGLCVAQQCGPLILQCLQDPSCQQILQCVATKCFGGVLGGGGDGGGGGKGGGGGTGGLDPVCLLTCASGQGKGTGEALEVVQCLTQTCSGKCGNILGGLGGLGGGGAGGFGGGFGEPSQQRDERRQELRQIFSPWPELSSSFDGR